MRDTINRLRKKLGLTHWEIARLVGAASASLYWLTVGAEPRLESVQRAALTYLQIVLQWPPEKRAAKIRAVKAALKKGGTLAGLSELLSELAEPFLQRDPQ